MGTLDGKTALITGAAAGIGRATAEAMAAEGANLVLTDIDTIEGQALAEKLKGEGAKAIFLQQDVVDEARWGQVISEAETEFGQLDILVNNAGIAPSGAITELALADWERMMEVNVDSVFLGVKYAIPAMRKAGGGSIINLSSIAGIKGSPLMSAYNASKGAVRLFTKGVAKEVAAEKIRVNSVHPGIIQTQIWGQIDEGLGGLLPREEGANEIDYDGVAQSMNIPMGHSGTPAEIANGIVFLASDASSHMTGAELVIDGGFTS